MPLGPFYAKYNTQTTFYFALDKAASVQDFAATADWTPATGDTKISKDGGNVANTSNNPAAVGGTGSALWALTLTATELSAADVVVQIVDSAVKAVNDHVLVIYTYGNASAKVPFDLSIALQSVSVSRWNGTTVATPATAGIPEVNVKNINNVSAASVTTVNANQGTTQHVNFTGTGASAFVNSSLNSNLKKNTALASFEFVMTSSTTHLPVTGKIVTVTRSIDGGAFASGTLSAVSEVANGMYAVSFGAGDLNGNVVTLRAIATGCDDTLVTIVTDP